MEGAYETSSVQEREFTEDQHKIWATLYERQLPKVMEHAHQDYLDGFEILDLPTDRIPTLTQLNSKITPNTGWKTIRTDVRYTDAVPWYHHFERREFLVTNYLRSWDELEFTPEPDMFHDIFGHLPFMTLPHYTALQDMFAPAFLKATTDEQRENIKRLAWYCTEFGMTNENGERKVFGAGLMSSSSEIEHVMDGKTPVKPYTIETVTEIPKSVWSFNDVLFEFESIEAVKAELAEYFDTF